MYLFTNVLMYVPLYISIHVVMYALPHSPTYVKIGEGLVEAFIMMKEQVKGIGSLLHCVWDYNGRNLRTIESLVAQDRPFVQIDEICHKLDATKVCSGTCDGSNTY